MKNAKILLLPLLAAPLLAAILPASAEVRFGPAEDSSITKVFTSESTQSMESFEMAMNGEEMDMEMEMEIVSLSNFTVTDTYLALGDGRPEKLERSYDELSMEGSMSMSSMMMGSSDQDMEGSSELEGTTVVFSWDEEDEEFTVAFAEGEEADEELLEGLWEDMDLRGILPASATVEEGDSWRIDNDLLVQIFAPGGNLKIIPEEAAEAMGMPDTGMNDMSTLMGDVEGSALATLDGTREIDGLTVAVISFVVDISGANDITDMLQDAVEDMETPEGMGDMELNYDAADVEFALEGEGELLWNLAAGHAHGFEFEGDLETTMDMAISISMMGQNMEQEVSMEMSGTMRIEMEIGEEEEE